MRGTPFLLALMLALLACSTIAHAAQNRRGDRLFRNFPLHESLVPKSAVATDGPSLDEQAPSVGKYVAKVKSLASKLLLRRSAALDAARQAQRHGTKVKVNARASKTRKTAAANSNEIDENVTTFHTYDSEAVVLFGTADLLRVRKLLEGENYKPMALGKSGKCGVAMWLVNHKDTTLGSYNELMVTTFAAPRSLDYTLGIEYINDAALLFPMFGRLRKHARLFVLHRSADSDSARRYLAEAHGMPVQSLSASSIVSEEFGTAGVLSSNGTTTRVRFNFRDASGRLLVRGRVEEDRSWGAWYESASDIFHALGLSSIIDLWYAKHMSITMASPSQKGGINTRKHMDFERRAFHRIKGLKLELGERTDLGRLLRDTNFDAKYVMHLPVFQYALAVPLRRRTDRDHEAEQLKWLERDVRVSLSSGGGAPSADL